MNTIWTKAQVRAAIEVCALLQQAERLIDGAGFSPDGRVAEARLCINVETATTHARYIAQYRPPEAE